MGVFWFLRRLFHNRDPLSSSSREERRRRRAELHATETTYNPLQAETFFEEHTTAMASHASSLSTSRSTNTGERWPLRYSYETCTTSATTHSVTAAVNSAPRPDLPNYDTIRRAYDARYTSFDDIFSSDPLGTPNMMPLRPPPPPPSTRYTAHSSLLRQPQLRTIQYNSGRGLVLLLALRRALCLPLSWTPAATLVYLLRHPRVREAVLPLDTASCMRRCNALRWQGVQETMTSSDVSHHRHWYHHPGSDESCCCGLPLFSAKDRAVVAAWLVSGEPLFTRGTTTRPALLLREHRPEKQDKQERQEQQEKQENQERRWRRHLQRPFPTRPSPLSTSSFPDPQPQTM